MEFAFKADSSLAWFIGDSWCGSPRIAYVNHDVDNSFKFVYTFIRIALLVEKGWDAVNCSRRNSGVEDKFCRCSRRGTIISAFVHDLFTIVSRFFNEFFTIFLTTLRINLFVDDLLTILSLFPLLGPLTFKMFTYSNRFCHDFSWITTCLFDRFSITLKPKLLNSHHSTKDSHDPSILNFCRWSIQHTASTICC